MIGFRHLCTPQTLIGNNVLSLSFRKMLLSLTIWHSITFDVFFFKFNDTSDAYQSFSSICNVTHVVFFHAPRL